MQANRWGSTSVAEITIVDIINNTSLQILTLKKYSPRKVLFFINLHMLNTKFIINT
jgi:hypothetical protein